MKSIPCNCCKTKVKTLYDDMCSECYISLHVFNNVKITRARDVKAPKKPKEYKFNRFLEKGEIVKGSDKADLGNGWEVLGDNNCAVGKPAYSSHNFLRGSNKQFT